MFPLARDRARRWLQQRRWHLGCATLIAAVAMVGIANTSAPTPLSVAMIPVPSRFDSFLAQTGNIQVTFSDGHTEMWTQSGNAILPRKSRRGDIGWVELDKRQIDVAAKNRRGQDKLVVRLHDGVRREFTMNADIPFIRNWSFAENDTAVSIQMSGYHGAASYIEYDLRTGQAKDQIIGYVSPETLPAWAKQVSDDGSNP
jgi:hypothetical protein